MQWEAEGEEAHCSQKVAKNELFKIKSKKIKMNKYTQNLNGSISRSGCWQNINIYTLRNGVLELCSWFSGLVFNMSVLNKRGRLLYEKEILCSVVFALEWFSVPTCCIYDQLFPLLWSLHEVGEGVWGLGLNLGCVMQRAGYKSLWMQLSPFVCQQHSSRLGNPLVHFVVLFLECTHSSLFDATTENLEYYKGCMCVFASPYSHPISLPCPLFW